MKVRPLPVIVIILALSGWFFYSKDKAPAPINTATRTPTSTPRISRTPAPSALPATILLSVPFTSQAPLGNWSDPRQQDGCEEASMLMTMHWVRGTTFSSPQKAEEEILALAEYQIEKYGHSTDTSAADSAKILKEYFNYDKVRVEYDITLDEIKKELVAGNVVLVPAWGRNLPNPNFTPPGPLNHMLVIKGYDNKTQEFITNDPGTRLGANFRYHYTVMDEAFFDYPTGHHLPHTIQRSAMIVVEKN